VRVSAGFHVAMDASLRCGEGFIVDRYGLAGQNRCFRERYAKNGGMAENKMPSSNRPLSQLCSFTVTFAFMRKRDSAPGKLSTKGLVFWDFCPAMEWTQRKSIDIK
jgi:hypothetical protein